MDILSAKTKAPDRLVLPEIVVRPPMPADIPGLAALLLEMQVHYGRPVPLVAAIEAATHACTRSTYRFAPRVLLALADGTVIGSIVMNVSFPAFALTQSLYIRDLYVAGVMRRSGIGRALVKAAARLALTEGFSALEWTTDSGNVAARSMYEFVRRATPGSHLLSPLR